MFTKLYSAVYLPSRFLYRSFMIRNVLILRMAFSTRMRILECALLYSRWFGVRSLPGLRLMGAVLSSPGTTLRIAMYAVSL